MKNLILKKIRKNGGWINAHGHFDRSYTVTPRTLSQSSALMEKKWTLVDTVKRQSSEKDYFERIDASVKTMIAQGVSAAATFIDVDSLTELRAISAAVAVRKKYRKTFTLLLINQVLKGVVEKSARLWAEKALEYVDIIGGLPSKDRPNDSKHLDILFSWAKATGKMVHVHIDQENNPKEHDVNMLTRKTIEYGLEGKVGAIHAVSLAAQSPKKRKESYREMKAAGLFVVCCPSAAISMKQLPYRSLLHNSIAPVPELVAAGIPVALGVDNISDIYQPLIDGDMYTELRFLAEANRFYNIDALVDIATKNGRTALGI